ncbi:MAG: cyclase family protein [Chloroflexota bacterium]
MLYDITRTVSADTAVFPGDTPFSAKLNWRMSDGAPVNLTTITTTPHVGTHADAYFHYTPDGVHPKDMPLDPYIGRARLITVSKRSGEITANDFPAGALDGVERLLIHSWVSDVPDDQWTTDFPYPSVGLLERLAQGGGVLIGLDVSSVDSVDSASLPAHHAVKRLGMVNLENLMLRGVPDGDYELIALPLKLDAACGSPVRAVLRTL